jgi:hypothetical protein
VRLYEQTRRSAERGRSGAETFEPIVRPAEKARSGS